MVGRFDDLPIDVVWLILRQVLIEQYHGEELLYFRRFRLREWARNTRFFCMKHSKGLAEIIIPLSGLNKRIRRLLKAKCQWNQTGSFGFIKGSITCEIED